MATEAELRAALIKADAAGDTQAAQLFADTIKAQRAAGGGQGAPRNTGQDKPVSGFVDTLNRSIPGVSELGAGLTTLAGAADDAMAGRPVDIGREWQQARAIQQGHVDQFKENHPAASSLTTGVGLAAPLAVGMATGGATAAPTVARALSGGAKAVASRVGRNALTGAAIGGVYGASQPGTVQQRIQSADNALAPGAMFGAAVPEAVSTGAKAVNAFGAGADNLGTAAGRLTAQGVPVLPGQRLGGAFKALEEKATSVPILGDAIAGAAGRGKEGLNRAFAARALAPVGETIPADVKVGHDTIAHVQNVLGQRYDQVGKLVSNLAPDAPFATEVAKISDTLKDYPKAVQEQFADIIRNRVTEPLTGGSGSGDQFIGITSQIRKLAARYGKSTDGAQQGLGDALNDLHSALTDLGGRQNPAYAEAKGPVDQGYATFKQLQRAGQAAGSRDGVATVAQLKAAVRNSDNSVDNGEFAAGRARNQDLIRDADAVMGGAYPDSGTASRLAINALALGGGHAVAPGVTVPAAAGLGVASLPYLATGRGMGNAFANADPTLSAQLASRARNALAAPSVSAKAIPRSVTALEFFPSILAGEDRRRALPVE